MERNVSVRVDGMTRDADLNLLIALDVLLDEESVTGAADRLLLSAPAMSRTLARIRTAFDDPILVRSGRAMTPTPRARALHPEVKAVLDRSRALFADGRPLHEAGLRQTFTITASDYFPASVSASLIPGLRERAPGVNVVFLGEGHRSEQPLREGVADLEIGVPGPLAPETIVEPLYTDRMVAVVRRGHQLTVRAAGRELTPAEFARELHVSTSRRGRRHGPLDEALAQVGLERQVVAALPSFASTLLLVAATDLVGLAPERVVAPEIERVGLATFPVPVPLPSVDVSMAWHPRNDRDPAQRWFRGLVREALLGQRSAAR
jgi:DNA-binding transcriptional LysR family regulator